MLIVESNESRGRNYTSIPFLKGKKCVRAWNSFSQSEYSEKYMFIF